MCRKNIPIDQFFIWLSFIDVHYVWWKVTRVWDKAFPGYTPVPLFSVGKLLYVLMFSCQPSLGGNVIFRLLFEIHGLLFVSWQWTLLCNLPGLSKMLQRKSNLFFYLLSRRELWHNLPYFYPRICWNTIFLFPWRNCTRQNSYKDIYFRNTGIYQWMYYYLNVALDFNLFW